jgi:hypothetical protein
MPTIEEIRKEWHGVRSAVGTLVCYIDGKVAQLQDMSEAYRKGYNDGIEKGSLDVKDRVSCAYQDGYAKGLEAAWETACRIVQMDVRKRAEVFFLDSVAVTHDEPFKHYSAEEAMQKLKEYDAIIHQVTHSNAQKFVEVFGFAPGYEILDDGREVYPSLNDEWWNAEYKEPAEDGE